MDKAGSINCAKIVQTVLTLWAKIDWHKILRRKVCIVKKSTQGRVVECFCDITGVWKEDKRVSGVNGLLFKLQASSTEATTCNIPVYWVLAIRSQCLWVLFSLFMLWGSSRRSKQTQSSHDTLIPRTHNAVLISWMTKMRVRVVGENCDDDCE